MRKLFTSESVTEGHPDKVCDRISDAVLDAVLAVDPNGRVACETCCTTDTVFIAGEITSKVDVNIVGIARRVLRDIGYTGGASGFNANTCKIEVAVHKQSPDIAMGTGDDVGGAGDQGMMFGYACSETEQLMPLPIMLAHQMAYRLTQRRKDGTIPFILPDGKTQVTVEYGEDGMPSRIDTIVISTQHYENATEEQLLESLTENVITPILKYAKHFAGVYGGDLDIDTYNLYINPTGRFVQGGPAADTGLTGRKIIVDTYGGYAPHGGGAFSGKDPTKVDRSAAYMARYIAKNIVDAGICSRCQVQLAYAIGVAEPVSVRIDTFGGADEEKLARLKHLKQLAQKAKAESDAVATRVKALEDVGAQANVLETIKVNGVVQSIEDKAVDIKVPGYTVEKSEKSGDYAAVYRLMKDGVAVGAAINIPKDMVVKSGSVVTNPTGQPKGTYIKLVLANATNDTLYVDVGGLIEYVTSGSAAGDMVVITIDEQTHKVTASITDGAITKAKLETEVQTALNKAHEHANAAELDKIATGDKAKWDATSAKVEGIAEGATKVEAGTTEGNIKINGVETAVVTIATDAEVTEMLTEVFGATA